MWSLLLHVWEGFTHKWKLQPKHQTGDKQNLLFKQQFDLFKRKEKESLGCIRLKSVAKSSLLFLQYTLNWKANNGQNSGVIWTISNTVIRWGSLSKLSIQVNSWKNYIYHIAFQNSTKCYALKSQWLLEYKEMWGTVRLSADLPLAGSKESTPQSIQFPSPSPG